MYELPEKVIKKSNEKNNNRGGDFKCVNDQLPKR